VRMVSARSLTGVGAFFAVVDDAAKLVDKAACAGAQPCRDIESVADYVDYMHGYHARYELLVSDIKIMINGVILRCNAIDDYSAA